MEKINLYEIKSELKPNEKLLLDSSECTKTFLCKCRGGYSTEYFYKQKLVMILEGAITIKLGEKEYLFEKGDFFKMTDSENLKIIESDALILTIIEEK